MPHFVPVYDPERPRAEQTAADPALRIHRRWETPHALLSAEVAERGENERDDRPVKLKPVRGQMVRNEKGLWVPVAQAKGEAARREQQHQRALRKWCRSFPDAKDEVEEKDVFDSGRDGGEDSRSAVPTARRGSGEAGGEKREQLSPTAAEGSSYAHQSGGRLKWSRSDIVRLRGARGSDGEASKGRTGEGNGTPSSTYESMKRYKVAAQNADDHAKGVSSYHRRAFRSRSGERGRRENARESATGRKSEREANNRRSRSSSLSRRRCGTTHSIGYRHESPERTRRPSPETEVTLTSVTAPSGKIDMFDYMTKKQKALLRQHTQSFSALPRRR